MNKQTTNNLELKKLLKEYSDSGRAVFVYPRKKRVSLNGFPSKSYEDTLVSLREWKATQHYE
jgi:hypothetical protein